ncbi:hypothetical protein ACEYYH_10515 [Microbacterium trichothecenolyticum]|uniref:phage portal protein family protein n=1 Tax=Microbacterium trichothecenolyticum TaxID=69370 RepID=UPI0035BE7B7F
MSEIGYQSGGLSSWGTIAAEANETNPDLLWPKSLEVYDRMANEDPQVGSVLRAVTLPILRTTWMIDGTGCRPNVVEHVAADLGLPEKGKDPVAPLRMKGRFSWTDHLRLALLELRYGHSPFEQVYRVEGNLNRLHKLAWRPPRSISDIEVARDGGLVALKQYGIGGQTTVRIPVDRLVMYVNEREGANWTGRSLLRQAYKMWLLKDRVLRAQALTIERNGLGVPVYTGAEVPEGVTGTDREAWEKSEQEAGLKLAKDFKAGEAAGASLPHGATLQLLGVSGKLPDTDAPIRYYDEQIARAVLAHFLNLGTETGSWALGSTFANFFTESLNAVAQHIADVTQQHVIEDLVDLNYGPNERAPRLVPAPIGAEHPVTAEAIKALIDCGALSKDPGLEAHLRELWGLPSLAAELAAKGVPVEAAREAARFAAETAQKVYLAADAPPLTRREARDLLRDAGMTLDPASDNPAEEAAA